MDVNILMGCLLILNQFNVSPPPPLLNVSTPVNLIFVEILRLLFCNTTMGMYGHPYIESATDSLILFTDVISMCKLVSVLYIIVFMHGMFIAICVVLFFFFFFFNSALMMTSDPL